MADAGRPMEVPKEIVLPDLAHGSEVLVLGLSPSQRLAGPLLASQLRSLDVSTLYVDRQQSVLGLRPMVVDDARAARSVAWQCKGNLWADLIPAAAAMGIRVVAVADWREQERLESALLARSIGVREAVEATAAIERRVAQGMAQQIAADRKSEVGRGLAVVQADLVRDRVMADGTVSGGILTSLGGLGVNARGAMAVGELTPLATQVPHLDRVLRDRRADRTSGFVMSVDGQLDYLHFPERPMDFDVLYAMFHRSGAGDSGRGNELLDCLSTDDPTRSFLLGSAERRRARLDAATAAFRRGAELGEGVQLVEAARTLMMGDLGTVPSAGSVREAAELYRAAIDRGVPGAARIAAGHMANYAPDAARELTLLADHQEVMDDRLWNGGPGRSITRERIRRHVKRASDGRLGGPSADLPPGRQAPALPPGGSSAQRQHRPGLGRMSL